MMMTTSMATKIMVATAMVVVLTQVARADVYLHHPRGSNNRCCETAENRDNGNRLFDSQNNDAGGYACPRATTFACYKAADQNACNQKNTGNPGPQMVSSLPPNDVIQVDGQSAVTDPDVTNTERAFYFAGSEMPIELTSQHSCGSANDKVHCEVVIQVACEDTLTDDCGLGGESKCSPRDGTPVNNNKGDALNGRCTTTISDNDVTQQNDYRYGRHETYRYYQECKARERNKGLFIADQKVNGNSARFSRQNPNGNRNGLECPEESEYWPYWHPSPWRDIAVLTSDVSRCAMYEAESQNVKSKGYCECNAGNGCPGNQEGRVPNNKEACEAKGATWKEEASYDMPPPECLSAPFSRDNHLGNLAGAAQMNWYNWTIPESLAGKDTCILRVRYNISSGDVNDTSVFADSKMNGDRSPLIDRNNREELSYMKILGSRSGIVQNTNQLGRTFQDRSYSFRIKSKNDDPKFKKCGKIRNLGVRGKRGNIVQVYPNVEYDFVPSDMTVSQSDCLHIQFVGSDYNPNRNPNNAEGGPPDPQNQGQARADRTNIVQSMSATNNMPILGDDMSLYTMFEAPKEVWTSLAYLNQPIDDPTKCLTVQQLKQQGINNRQQRERDYRNCGKLSGQETPYFNVNVPVKPGKPGKYTYVSTRNNNFSNRGQKGHLTVTAGAGKTVGVVLGVIAGIGLAGAAAVVGFRKFGGGKSGSGYQSGGAGASGTPTEIVVGGASTVKKGSGKAVALYDHEAKEPGELSFRKGEIVTISNRDPSGWWTGRTESGAVGIFPNNYVKV